MSTRSVSPSVIDVTVAGSASAGTPAGAPSPCCWRLAVTPAPAAPSPPPDAGPSRDSSTAARAMSSRTRRPRRITGSLRVACAAGRDARWLVGLLGIHRRPRGVHQAVGPVPLVHLQERLQ